MIKKTLLALAALVAAFSFAQAQTGFVSDHAVPIGKGPGVTGFGEAAPGTAGRVLTSNGASADPTFQSLPTAPVITNHAVALGTGVAGTWGTAAPSTAGFVLFSNGASLDPSFQSLPYATTAQVIAGSTASLVTPSVIYSAETTVTFSATPTFDFATFINAAITLTGNITTMNVSNVKAGQAGMITFIQDGTGSRTTVFNSIFKFAGGTPPTLTTTASRVDVLTYSCRSATFCVASLLNDVR